MALAKLKKSDVVGVIRREVGGDYVKEPKKVKVPHLKKVRAKFKGEDTVGSLDDTVTVETGMLCLDSCLVRIATPDGLREASLDQIYFVPKDWDGKLTHIST